jgi:hypothetical protein
MKIIKPSFALLTGIGVISLAEGATANIVNGTISFSSAAVVANALNLKDATTVDGVVDPVVTGGTGDYAAVPDGTPLIFGPSIFIPDSSGLLPLWTFTIGTKTYGFESTSISSTFDSSDDTWNISGSGYAFITGETPSTSATWDVTLSQDGNDGALTWKSTSSVPIPDGLNAGAALAGCLGAFGAVNRITSGKHGRRGAL